MAAHAPGGGPHPPTTAVVQVAEDGTAKLYLGTELVEHAAGVDASAVMRVLVDYAAAIDTGVRVTTQMPDGTWTRHRLDPKGTLTPLPRHLPVAPTAGSPLRSTEVAQSRRPEARLLIRTRVTQGWVLTMLVVLVAALVAVVAMT